jgi:hypothetical protein
MWILNVILRHRNQVIIFPTSGAYRSVDSVEKAVSDGAGAGS